MLQSGHQNPRWPPKWPQKYLTFNLYELESHLIPLCMGYQVLQNHSWNWCCNPGTSIQDGRRNDPMKKASGVDMLLTAAFGGVADIITDKSWTDALRAYRLITAVLHQDFFQSCARMYQELSEDVLGGSQKPPGWEALGGQSDQAHSSSLAVTACTVKQRLPTPTGQPRCDDALHLCGRAHELRTLA